MNPFLKIIGKCYQAAEAREDANDTLVAFAYGKATEMECQLALSVAITEANKAIAGLREQVLLFQQAAQHLDVKEAA